MKSFHVRLVDDNVASIYESSRFATSDLKEHPRLVRRAVALGRACVEPLTVLCTLMAASPAELLALQLHPLQVWIMPLHWLFFAIRRVLCFPGADRASICCRWETFS